MKTIEEKVIGIIRFVKDIKYPITPEMSLTDDLYLDSLDMLMLINAVESEFSFSVDMGEVEKIKTVQDIIDVLETELHKAAEHETH